MPRLWYTVVALVLALTVVAGSKPFAPAILPTVPKAQAANVPIVLIGFVGGWNASTTPNPTITVTQGDTVSLSLSSGDSVLHRFLLDVDRDGGLDTADCPAVDPCSAPFSTPTIVTYSFTASFATGTYTYFCTVHPGSMFGSFVVNPSSAVGGLDVPVDKLALLAPYIGIVTAVLGIIIGTRVYFRRASRKTK